MVVVTFLFFFVDKHNWKMKKLFRYCGQLLLGNRYVTLSKVYFWLVKAVQMKTFTNWSLPMIQFGVIHNFQIPVISPPLLPPSLHPPSPGKMVIKIFLTLVKWVIYLFNAFLMSLFSIVNLDFLFLCFFCSKCLFKVHNFFTYWNCTQHKGSMKLVQSAILTFTSFSQNVFVNFGVKGFKDQSTLC